MKLLLTIALIVAFDNLYVGQACSRCQGGISGVGGRRKRDAESQQTIEAVRSTAICSIIYILRQLNLNLGKERAPDFRRRAH